MIECFNISFPVDEETVSSCHGPLKRLTSRWTRKSPEFTFTKPLRLSGPYYHGNQGVASTITPFWVVPPPEVSTRMVLQPCYLTVSDAVTRAHVSLKLVHRPPSRSNGPMTTVSRWRSRSPTYRTTFSPVTFLMRWYSRSPVKILQRNSFCKSLYIYGPFCSLQMLLVDYYRSAPDLIHFSQYWCPDTTMMDKIKVG